MFTQTVIELWPFKVTIFKCLAAPPRNRRQRNDHPANDQINGFRDHFLV